MSINLTVTFKRMKPKLREPQGWTSQLWPETSTASFNKRQNTEPARIIADANITNHQLYLIDIQRILHPKHQSTCCSQGHTESPLR